MLFSLFSFSLNSFSLIYTLGPKEFLTARVFSDSKLASAVFVSRVLKMKEITVTVLVNL